MTDLIATQLVVCTVILVVFAISLKRGILRRLFGSRYEERDLLPLKVLLVCTMLYLVFFMSRDVWRVIR
jgi:hypothetical protein